MTFRHNSRTSRQEFIRSNMGDETRTLRELTAADLTLQPLAVRVPALGEGVNFELKSGVINLLPKFHGLAGEDPIMHLSEFRGICICSKPENVIEEYIKMRAFGFTLKESARNWYYHLPAGTIDTWAKLHKAFLGISLTSSREMMSPPMTTVSDSLSCVPVPCFTGTMRRS